MKKNIDLHVHSTYSDGTLSPSELVQLAGEKNLAAFALTDHDTTDGISEALHTAKSCSLKVIPGIEFSTEYKGTDIHILGYNMDYENAHFQEKLQGFRNVRDIRNQKMINKMQEHHINISWEIMMEQYPDSVWTRAHFARYLIDHEYVRSKNEAFDRYLGPHASCYVPRERISPYEAISLIHEFGGLASLAHPLLYRFSTEKLETLVSSLSKAGLDGMEVLYSSNRPAETLYLKQLAIKNQLKITGGSDFHGSNKPGLDLGCGYGKLEIPYSVWETFSK